MTGSGFVRVIRQRRATEARRLPTVPLSDSETGGRSAAAWGRSTASMRVAAVAPAPALLRWFRRISRYTPSPPITRRFSSRSNVHRAFAGRLRLLGCEAPGMPRGLVIVMDSAGVGALPDASHFGDAPGANTIGNVAEHCGGLHLPNFARLGLGNVTRIRGVPKTDFLKRLSHGLPSARTEKIRSPGIGRWPGFI